MTEMTPEDKWRYVKYQGLGDTNKKLARSKPGLGLGRHEHHKFRHWLPTEVILDKTFAYGDYPMGEANVVITTRIESKL